MRSAKFSTIPFSTIWTRPDWSSCGWAFSCVTRPWVAQRVWPTPEVALEARRCGPPTASRRCLRLPTAWTESISPSVHQREAGRVVAAVLEPLESGQDQVEAAAAAGVADDSAHGGRVSLAASPFRRARASASIFEICGPQRCISRVHRARSGAPAEASGVAADAPQPTHPRPTDWLHALPLPPCRRRLGARSHARARSGSGRAELAASSSASAGDALALLLVGRLDHHPHERLVPEGDEHPAAALEAAGRLHRLPADRRSASRGSTRTLISRWGSFSIARRSARSPPCKRLEREQGRRRAVPGRHEAGVDDVPRLLAPERPAAAEQLGQHVAVAHRGRRPPRCPRLAHRACGSRSWSSRSRSPRRRAGGPARAGASAASASSSSPSTTAPRAVHGQHPVAVAVEGEGDVEVARTLRRALDVRRAAAVVDVAPVGLDRPPPPPRRPAAGRSPAPRGRWRRSRSPAAPACRTGRGRAKRSSSSRR